MKKEDVSVAMWDVVWVFPLVMLLVKMIEYRMAKFGAFPAIVEWGVPCFVSGIDVWIRAHWCQRRREQRERLASGQCENCGYDLTGNTSGRCPECGCATKSLVGKDGDAGP